MSVSPRLSLVALLALAGSANAVTDACDAFGPLTDASPLSAGDARISGEFRNQGVGRAVAVGDFDGDGNADLVVGVPGDGTNGGTAGAVAVFYGPIADDGDLAVSAADALLAGASGGLRAGSSLANAGDLDGDGRDDLVVGSDPTSTSAYPAGVVWVVSGSSVTGVADLDAVATAVLVGESAGDDFGTEVASAGDLDGDGVPDVVVGAPLADVGFTNNGRAYVFHGPLLGTVGAASADVRFTGLGDNHRVGGAVGGVGDVDGDGTDDLAIGAPRETTQGSRAGTTYVLSGGALSGDVDLGSAPTQLRGDSYDRFGSAVAPAGDVDGDGVDDFWVGARQRGGLKRGAAYLFLGGAPFGDLRAQDAFAGRLDGFNANDLLGGAIVGDVDFDADGVIDVGVGAERADGGGTATTGGGWAAHGPFSGTRRLLPDEGAYYGQTRDAQAGAGIAAGDLNGDGFDDLVVGAWRDNVDGVRRGGRVAVFLGGHDLVDEQVWLADADGDGWGDDADPGVLACVAPSGTVVAAGDCDDGDGAIHPFAPEGDCGDPTDYNCDGSVGTVDADGDGFDACDGDCDDRQSAINAGAEERCGDAVDNDCDGGVDDAGAVDARDWYPDSDGDGFGNEAVGIRACEDPGVFLGRVPRGAHPRRRRLRRRGPAGEPRGCGGLRHPRQRLQRGRRRGRRAGRWRVVRRRGR
jgi:hypothetical protein